MNNRYTKSLFILKNLFFLFLAVAFSVSLLLGLIGRQAVNEKHLQEQYVKYKSGPAAELSEAQYHQVIRQLTEYLAGYQKSPNTFFEKNDKMVPFFNQAELAHLLDVKVILVLVSRLKWIGIVILLLFLLPYSIYVILRCSKQRNAKTVQIRRLFWFHLAKVLSLQFVVSTLLMLSVSALAYINFKKYFFYAYKQLFGYDFQAFRSASSNLIALFPDTTVIDIAFKIALQYGLISISFGLAGFVCYLLLKKDMDV